MVPLPLLSSRRSTRQASSPRERSSSQSRPIAAETAGAAYARRDDHAQSSAAGRRADAADNASVLNASDSVDKVAAASDEAAAASNNAADATV